MVTDGIFNVVGGIFNYKYAIFIVVDGIFNVVGDIFYNKNGIFNLLFVIL